MAAEKTHVFLMFHSNIFNYQHVGDIFHFCSIYYSDVCSSGGYPTFKNVEILLSGNILIICHCLLLTGYYHKNLELFSEQFCLFWHIDINNLQYYMK